MNVNPVVARISRLRVPLGGALAIAVLLLAHPTGLSLAAGLVVSAIGEAVRIWSAGYLRKNSALAASGPYRHTRNPLYVGNLLAGIGVVVAAARPWLAVAFLVYYLVVYVATMRKEEAALVALFPGSYDDYRRAVPAFVPRLTPAQLPRIPAVPFDRTQVWRNREYRALTALALIYAVLLARLVLG